jgi:hypothetical protein
MATAATSQTWRGRSDDISVPLLSAEFWTEGREVAGTFEGAREQKIGGVAFKLALDVPVTVDGEEVSLVELPSLTGVKNAIQSMRNQGYQFRPGDMWRVQCVGIRKAKKEGFSDSPEFQIDVIRK